MTLTVLDKMSASASEDPAVAMEALMPLFMHEHDAENETELMLQASMAQSFDNSCAPPWVFEAAPEQNGDGGDNEEEEEEEEGEEEGAAVVREYWPACLVGEDPRAYLTRFYWILDPGQYGFNVRQVMTDYKVAITAALQEFLDIKHRPDEAAEGEQVWGFRITVSTAERNLPFAVHTGDWISFNPELSNWSATWDTLLLRLIPPVLGEYKRRERKSREDQVAFPGLVFTALELEILLRYNT